MPSTNDLKTRIEAAIPGAEAEVVDLNGTGDHFRATVIASGPESDRGLPASWGFAGPGRVDGAKLSRHVPDIAERHVLVSGPPAMVNGIQGALRTMGVRRVKADYFSGY